MRVMSMLTRLRRWFRRRAEPPVSAERWSYVKGDGSALSHRALEQQDVQHDRPTQERRDAWEAMASRRGYRIDRMKRW